MSNGRLSDFLRSVKQAGASAVVDIDGIGHKMYDSAGRVVSQAKTGVASAINPDTVPDVTAELKAIAAKFAAAGQQVLVALHVTPAALEADAAKVATAVETAAAPAVAAAEQAAVTAATSETTKVAAEVVADVAAAVAK